MILYYKSEMTIEKVEVAAITTRQVQTKKMIILVQRYVPFSNVLMH